MKYAPSPGPGLRGPAIADHIKAIPQYLYPQHLLSRLMGKAMRIRALRIKDRQIRWFIRHYGVDMEEALSPDPLSYGNFNDFFTRALAPDARPIAAGNDQVISPADGRISALGTIDGSKMLQAKGREYTVPKLLSGNALDGDTFAAPFQNGQFVTIYLSPRDYHRVHLPVAGRPRGMRYVPGRLFSVNPATTRVIPRLFTRNERVAMVFDTKKGPLGLVMVGAIFVGSIETAWAGAITPSYGQPVSLWEYDRARHPELTFRQGQEIARFNMGSTVILLFPDTVNLAATLQPGARVRMGESIGRWA
uniref:Phosphatidylserine decarboxylase proenzyme n=1 Tax=Candidatus Kentrum sp. UNK TaxID=2126344 RepID=A0A451ANW4_9GAMM|nr:MAG: phosphatidylserine decarboxylase [Candidatus Kentron sp. UNK]VFK73083.1 MAG: phosphatidylserine decarboxylase [Candidatus Kentron sp. UNK]